MSRLHSLSAFRRKPALAEISLSRLLRTGAISMIRSFDEVLRNAAAVLLMLAVVSTAATAAADDSRNSQLQELIAEAMRNSPEIRAAGREREAAGHRVSPAGALDDPMLEAGVINAPLPRLRLNREDMTMKMLGLSQKVPYAGKRELRQDVAAKDAESVAHAYQETVNRVARDVKVAYFELATIAESTWLVERNKQVLEQFLGISESRYAVGQGNQADVLKAQTQISRMADELLKLGRERQAMAADLARALGRTTDAAAPVPSPLRPSAVALQFSVLRETALRERPQLLALKTLIDRSEKMLDLARKDYYPDFDVKLSYGQRERTLDGMRRDDMLSFTVAINLPVWQETKRDPRVAEAIAMRHQAQDMYQAQQNEMSAKLRQQIAGAEQSLQSARLYQNGILPQARLAVESSIAAYRVGRVDFLTLLDNQMTVLNYEISRASALSGYSKALAEIEFLAGKTLF
jgi:outer membrane protein TolC